MPNGPMNNVLRQIRRLVARPGAGAQSDEDLLERFIVHHEEEAFGALVRRHGPMVLGVCLRLLRHRQDAEDAFQATFLTLVRKGGSIRQRGSLASWLYRVAFRISLRLKARADKRNGSESLGDATVDADPSAEAAWRELRPLLDGELQKLPAKYRAPMVLCYLEGKTYEEVADELGCPKGTVAIRLLRAREMLKRRLVRRGLVAAAGAVMVHATLPAAQAAVTPGLAATTTSAAMAVSAGATLAATAPAGLAALVHEAGRSWWESKIGTLCAFVTCLGLSSFGLGGGVMSLVVTARMNAPSNWPEPTGAPTVAMNEEIPPAKAGQPRAVCVCVVELKFGPDKQLAEDTSAKPTPAQVEWGPGGALSRTIVTLHVPEDAIDAVRENGSVVLVPKNVEHTMVVLVRQDQDGCRPIPVSGLTLRERMRDDDLGPRPTATDELPPQPTAIAQSITGRPTRVITVTQQGQLSLFAGMLKIIFLRPVSYPRPTM
jgi:RNA polymerase sigma factor (sigma-70 family)